MQYQDFERDGDFYQSYDKQKLRSPQSRRNTPKPFTLRDLLIMLGAVAGIFIPIVFVLGMISGNGEVWIGATLAGMVAIGLVFIAVLVFIGLGIARLWSLFFTVKRAK